MLHESKAAQASLVGQVFDGGMELGNSDGDVFD
jgi:hypothetical protein